MPVLILYSLLDVATYIIVTTLNNIVTIIYVATYIIVNMLFNVADASTARCRGILQALLWHFRGIFIGLLVTNFDSVSIPLVKSQVSLSLPQIYKTKMEVDRRDRAMSCTAPVFITVVKSFIDQRPYSQHFDYFVT